MADALQNYVDGRWVDALDGERFDVFNPATGEVIATAPSSKRGRRRPGGRRRPPDASTRATWWPGTPARERGRILLRAAEIIRREQERLARLESIDSGKPIGDARGDLDEVAFMFEYFGGWATKIDGDVQHVSRDAMFMVWKEPIGVAAGITPWNYPMSMAVAEDRARDRGRLHVRPQAAGADAADLPRAAEDPRGGRPAARRAPRDHRARRDGGGAARRSPRRRQGRRSRAPGTSARVIVRSGRRHPEAGHARARRASRRTSCSPTPTSRPPSRARATASSGTRARSAPPARACSSTARSTTTRSNAFVEHAKARSPRRRARRGDDDGTPRQRRAAGARRALHRDRPGRGDPRGAGHACRPSRAWPNGYFVPPTIFADVENDRHDRARGDLRTRHVGDPVLGDVEDVVEHVERQRLRLGGRDLDERHQEGAPHRAGAPRRHRLDQRHAAGADRDARGAATSSPASAASSARTASRTTSSTSRSTSTSPSRRGPVSGDRDGARRVGHPSCTRS